MQKIWIDYMAPCDIFFFNSILRDLSIDDELVIKTARAHAETESLLADNNVKAKIIGSHNVASSTSQITSFINRNFQLYWNVPDFDISLSLANIYGIIVSLLRNKPSISVIDNDLIEYERSIMEKIAAKIHAKATWIIAPKSYPVHKTIEKGISKEKVFTFNGYKEDIYIADYAPNPKFLENIPFRDYIVLRPEALYSTYVHTTGSITPLLFEKFCKENINTIYLPRQKEDLKYLDFVKDKSNIWVPERALNGLDLAYHSKAVLTGSGTFAREAACMGRPAVSFFPDQLLAVDQSLIEKGKMFHSLDPEEIFNYVVSHFNANSDSSFKTNKIIKSEFMAILMSILEEGSKYGS